jgi:hypothetical protein
MDGSPAQVSSRARAKTLDTSSARERFEQRKVRTGANAAMQAELVASCDRHGYTQKAIADLCATSTQNVNDWFNPHHTALPNLAHMMCFPAEVRADLVRVMAQHSGLGCVPLAPGGGSALEGLALVEREGGEAKLATLRAIADGHESDAELVEQAREHQDAIDAHAGQLARCVRELKARRDAR